MVIEAHKSQVICHLQAGGPGKLVVLCSLSRKAWASGKPMGYVRAEDEMRWPRSVVRQEKKEWIPPSSAFCSLQALGALEDALPSVGLPIHHCFTESAHSNAILPRNTLRDTPEIMFGLGIHWPGRLTHKLNLHRVVYFEEDIILFWNKFWTRTWNSEALVQTTEVTCISLWSKSPILRFLSNEMGRQYLPSFMFVANIKWDHGHENICKLKNIIQYKLLVCVWPTTVTNKKYPMFSWPWIVDFLL